jgi:hypothetical protein
MKRKSTFQRLAGLPKLTSALCRILLGVREKVGQWSNWSKVKSLLAQGDIGEGIDLFHQRIDTCMQAYYVCLSSLVLFQRPQSFF